MTFFSVIKESVESVFPGLGNVTGPFAARRNNPTYSVSPISYGEYTYEEHHPIGRMQAIKAASGNVNAVNLSQSPPRDRVKEMLEVQ